MNIDELVKDSIKELILKNFDSLEGGKLNNEIGNIPSTGQSDASFSRMVGERVLVRAHRMGVNIGFVDSVDTEFLYLRDGRKFWRWWPKEGIALESFVKFGPKDGTRATAFNKLIPIRLDDVCGAYVVDSDDVWSQMNDWPISEQD